jgi:hypothetical protein
MSEPRTALTEALDKVQPSSPDWYRVIDECVRFLLRREAAAPSATEALRPWKWLYDDYEAGTVFITDDPTGEQRPIIAQSFDRRTANLIVEAHNARLAASPSIPDTDR